MTQVGTILALDIGAARVGLALASRAARLPSPYTTLLNNSTLLHELQAICAKEHVDQLVVGLPRGLDGQETAQTLTVQALGKDIAKDLNLPVAWQDEALTSVKAEAELASRRGIHHKEDVDALAAVYILEDYFRENV